MKSILVLMAPGFEEIELTAPVDILRRLGFSVLTAGLLVQRVEGAHGMVMEADALLQDVCAEKFDALVIPGGKASWLLRDTPAVLDLVRHMHAEKKLIAAICAAPLVLEAAGIAQGLTISCYPSDAVRKDLKSVAKISDAPTSTCGNIVTARGAGAALEFGLAIAHSLGKPQEATAMRQEMCI